MKGSHDKLRQRPSSLFMLLGWTVGSVQHNVGIGTTSLPTASDFSSHFQKFYKQRDVSYVISENYTGL
jgi:hypothetical protein